MTLRGYCVQFEGEYSDDVRNGRYYAFVPDVVKRVRQDHPHSTFRVIQVQKEWEDLTWSSAGNWIYSGNN